MDDLNEKLEEIFVKPKPTELEVKVEDITTIIPEIKSSIEENKSAIKSLEEKIDSIEIPEAINGIDGKDGEKGEKGEKGDTTIVEKVIEKTIIEQPITIDNTVTEIKEVALHDTGEQIIDKINELSLDPENQIDAKHIKNLPEVKQFIGGGSTARNLYQLQDVNIISPTNDQVLKFNSVTNLWENGTGGGGGVSGQATVDFGTNAQEDSIATVTVNTTSALASSIILVTPAGVATSDHDPDDYQWDNISGYVTNIVDGVSFDLVGVAPNGSWGQYVLNYVIN